jgi:hypothetical protein
MSTQTHTEVFYWGELPVGATVVTAFARKVEGRIVIQAMVKNPDGAEYEAASIPLTSIPTGSEVYLGPPTGPGTLLSDQPWHRGHWGPETRQSLRDAVVRASSREPLRGAVPMLLVPSEVTLVRPGLEGFPAECFIVMGRKATDVRSVPSWGAWRRWKDPEGNSRLAMTPSDQIPEGALVYVRADYLHPAEPVGPRAWEDHTFIPVHWGHESIALMSWDMVCRTPLQPRDERKFKIDKIFLYLNYLAAALQAVILLIDPAKRTSIKQIGWSAFVGSMVWSSRQTVAENEWFLTERMR